MKKQNGFQLPDDLEKEVELIKQKKSKLSANERRMVLAAYIRKKK